MPGVLPTVQNRVGTLDVLRGFAVLGILLANIPYFANGFYQALVPHEESVLDTWVHALTDFLVTGKFRSTLAILFGIGVYLQYRKRSALEDGWPGGYMKRCLFLGLIGLAHGFLIWFGDILFLYSIVAFAACFFVQASDRALRMIAWVLFGVSVFLSTLVGALAFVPNINQELAKEYADPYRLEMLTRTSGSFAENWVLNAKLYAQMVPQLLLIIPGILPLFLLGILLARHGVLQTPQGDTAIRRRLLVVGLAVGLPLNAIGLLRLAGVDGALFSFFFEGAAGPILACGYLMLVVRWAESGRGKSVLSALALVGRTALSCYLLQSITCTIVFAPWGLGLAGRLGRAECLGVVVAVWAVDIVFAMLWLRRYDIGPAEWLLRSLTEGKRLPLKYEKRSVGFEI